MNNRYIKTGLVSLSIWILAILINVILFAIVTFLQGSRGNLWQVMGLVLVVSSMYSFPGIVIFWLVFLCYCYHRKVFKILLLTAAVTSFLPVLYVVISAGNGSIHIQSMPLFSIAIFSPVIAVILHRPAVTNITNYTTNEIEVNEKNNSLET